MIHYPEPLPCINTPLCLLRPVVQADLPGVYTGLSNPDVTRYYAVHYDTLAATQGQMDFYAEQHSTKQGIFWAVCLPGSTALAGVVGLYYLHVQHQRAEAGIWLLPGQQGRGLGTASLMAALGYGFATMGLHRIYAEVETENAASTAMCTRAGMQHEGTLRQCELKDGKRIDLDVYAALAPHWLAAHANGKGVVEQE